MPVNPADYYRSTPAYPAEEVWCQRVEFLLYNRIHFDRQQLAREEERRIRIFQAQELMAMASNLWLARLRQVLRGEGGWRTPPDLRAAHEWLRKEEKDIEADLIAAGCREPERQLRRE